MFDLATRPQPSSADPAAVFGVPFDWRLTKPSAPSDYPYTDFLSPTGAPVPGIDVLATYALELEDSLATAVILSLFTDGRAGPDDALPWGQRNRRGWVGDEFASSGDGFGLGGDAWGSGLWLLYASKVLPNVLERARFAAQESLAWLVRDGVVDRVVVTAEWAGPRQDRLAVRPQLFKPDQVSPIYDVLWGTSLQRWANA